MNDELRPIKERESGLRLSILQQKLDDMKRNLTLDEVEALEAQGRKLCEDKGRAYLTY